MGTMTSKGPAPVTRSEGDNVTPQPSSRRSLLGAGVLGAALAVVASRTASASVPPKRPTEADSELLDVAMSLELTARDLYDAAIEAGADAELLTPFSRHHASYAQAIAGLTGVSANRRIDAVFDEAEGGFATSDSATVLASAYDLESTAVATHTELLGRLEGIDAAKLIASIVAVEARHCTVLADAAGNGDDLDALLTNSASPVSREDQS